MAIAALLATACGDEPPMGLPQATRYESARFVLYDHTNAPTALVDSMLARLEIEYDRVDSFLPEFPNPDSVVASILPGGGIPFVQLFDLTLNQFRNDLAFDYFVHQLTHLWTRYQRRPFLEEGIAVYATETLLPGRDAVSPYFKQPPHAWVSLFQSKGSLIPLTTVWEARNFAWSYDGSTADASVWQVFVEAGSFTRWVFDAFGREGWRSLYDSENFVAALGQGIDALEIEWADRASVLYPSPIACADALAPLTSRREFWCLLANGTLAEQ